jgi:protein-tyrosine phosphatase
MIIFLVLLLLKVPMKAITHDYLMSEGELEVEMEERIKEIRSIGLDEEFAGCPDAWVEEMHRYLWERYGGVEEYLKRIGFEEEVEVRLVDGLKA